MGGKQIPSFEKSEDVATKKLVVILLSGGYGTRLAPITEILPKGLLPIGEERIIETIIKGIYFDLGDMYDIYFYTLTNKRYFDIYKDWIKIISKKLTNLYRKGRAKFDIILADPKDDELHINTTYALYNAIKKIMDEGLNGPFLVIGSDTLINIDYGKLLSFLEEKDAPVIVSYWEEDIELVKQYSELVLDEEDRVIEMNEKPLKPKSNLVSTAIYLYPEGIDKWLEEYIGEKSKEFLINKNSPGYFIQWLHKKTKVYAYKYRGTWYDVGQRKTYVEAFKNYNIKKGTIVKSSKVSKSKLEGIVFVEEGSEISDSHIKDSYIGNSTRIMGCEIVDSIIIGDVEIENCKIVGCVMIGTKGKIRGTDIFEGKVLVRS